MEQIVKYKAVDGAEFKSKEECLKYDDLIERVDLVMSELPPQPKDDGCSFVNGGGFLQHEEVVFRSVKIKMLHIIKEFTDHEWVQQNIENKDGHPSYVARIVDDLGVRPLREWNRFYCTDEKFREWGQPFYAMNPERGEQIQINKEES